MQLKFHFEILLAFRNLVLTTIPIVEISFRSCRINGNMFQVYTWPLDRVTGDIGVITVIYLFMLLQFSPVKTRESNYARAVNNSVPINPGK